MNALRANILAICLGASLSVAAGTVIEGRDEGGGMHTIFIDGNKVKIEADDKTYMLIDIEKKSFLGVDPAEQRVVDLSELYKPTTGAKKNEDPLNVQMEKLGAGPKMAGFETSRYRVSVNGTVCSEEYLSAEAAKLADIATFFSTVVALSNPALEESVQANIADTAESLCARAEDQLNSKLYAKHGIPLKVVSPTGEVMHEITQIRGKENIEAKVFEAPEAFARLSIQEMEKALNEAMSQIRSAPPAGHPGLADSAPEESNTEQKKIQRNPSHP